MTAFQKLYDPRTWVSNHPTVLEIACAAVFGGAGTDVGHGSSLATLSVDSAR